MDSRGTGLVPLLSERHESHHAVKLIVPDSTAQVGMKHRLPVIAQWGYNCSLAAWGDPEEPEGNFWIRASEMRGYPLGAFAVRLLDDFRLETEPRDLGYLFPRQFPIWSSQLFTKSGELVRTTRVHIRPDGTAQNDFQIEVGQYPKTVGVPVRVESPEGTVIATALGLSGWPRLLPEGATFTVSADGEEIGRVEADQPVRVTVERETSITVDGPETVLPPEAGGQTVPFRAVLRLEPEEPGRALRVTLWVLRGTIPYEHQFVTPQVN